jgi:hypothetical protein
MVGNRAIYKDSWMASTTPLRVPWVTVGAEPNPDDFKWELYNINDDFSQSNDLAERFPGKLKELQEAFDVEARKFNVYPLVSSFASRADRAIRPSLTRDRSEFIYFPGMIRIPEGSALVDEKQVVQGRIPQTISVRFSLDETFDVGQDTGTPVREDYADRMPFRFTGTLKKFTVVLEPLKLSAEKQRLLHEQLAKAMAAVH